MTALHKNEKGVTPQSHEYGVGFSVSALQYMRAFFLIYPHLLENQHAVRVVSSLSKPSPHRNKDATRGIFNDPTWDETTTGKFHCKSMAPKRNGLIRPTMSQ